MSRSSLHKLNSAKAKAKIAFGSTGDPAEKNISAITAIENEALAHRSLGERAADAVVRQAGRLWFTFVHIIWFGTWLVVNARLVPGIPAFDPFPFQFLTLVVSLEAIFLSLFILMSQNRAGRQADSRSQLDLQINLLTEQESTKILQMLQKLCEHHNLSIAQDPELELLERPTRPQELLRELKAHLDEG